MEFISNLIKRPMSLVLSDSSDQLQPTQSRNISPIELNRDKCVNNENSLSNNMSINANNVQHIGSDKQDQSYENLIEESVLGHMGGDASGAIGDHELCQQLQSSTSSNATSSTIEELLIQINDNLNKASLEDEYLLPECPNDSAARLSPLTSKSATAIKLSPSPRPQIQTPITPTAYALPSPTAAAGSATLGTDSTIYKFHIDAELEAELLGESKPLAQENNNNTEVNKSNKFVGLTEFDESNIPELPDSLNPNIDDQLKLTFEEDLIPTFTANSIAGLNSTSKRDVNIKGLLVNETDTAVSSDNETFAECLSFQDIVNTTTAAKNALEYGNTTEMSDADTYRSALNSNNTTIGLGDQLNETLENVEDIVDEQLGVNFEPSLRELVTSRNNNEEQSVSPLPTNSKQNDGEHQFEEEVGVAAANVTFDEVEPMDVDMNETIDLPTTSNAPLTVESGGSDAAHTMNTRVSITPEMTLSSTSVGNVSEHNRLTYALERAQDQSSGPALVTPGNSQSLGSLGNVSEHNRLTFSVERPTGLSSSPALVPPRNSHSLDSLGNVSEHNRLTFSLARAEEQPNRPASATPENSRSLGSLGNTSNSRLTFSLERPEEQPNVARSDGENQLERSFMSNNECENIEVPFNQAIARVANECIIQDNSIDSATDVLPVSFEEEEDVDEHNGISDSTSACGENQREGNTSASDVATIENKLEVPHSSHNNVERNLNLTLNVNCSLDMGNKSFPNSPTFPVKAKMDKKQFPRSPVNENLTAVLEKSDYTEKLMKSPEIASAIKDDDLKEVNNLNETVDISDVVAQAISTVASARKSLSLLTHSADSIDNKNSSSVSLNTVGNNLNDTVDMSDIGAQGISSRPSPRTSFCLPVDHSVESIENNNASPVNVNSVAANKLNDTVDLSDIAAKEISPMPSPRTPLNAAVHTSDTPVENDSSSSANINGNEMPSPPIASSMMGMTSKANEKRRTFNIASPPVEEDLGKKSENRSSPNRFADKRRTFKMSPQQETDSFEPMDFDESMQFSAAQQFPPISNLILNPSDFDYLLTKGNNNVQVDRSSLLLKFDPLLGKPIPVDQPHLGRAQLSPTGEEDEHQNESNCSFVVDDNFAKELEEVSVKLKHRSLEVAQEFSQIQAKPKKNVRMSVDVINDMNIENDCKKSIENLNTQSDEKQSNFKMDELEKKIKNEVLKTEDIEKKLKEAELREEALIKRITEKDKTITKMNGVIEAYEKAIAELISEKEQLIQNYEKQLAEVKADRDSNYHHLTSLETTFSDLHVKYEKSKEMTSQLKSSEETLLSEKKQNLENLRLQEKRYEKMKNHAMQQLEIANKKLESLTHEHAIETTKLKALLKKEEISRASINEQLQQKTRENAELVKICDELINGR